jgi:hypothetical protein
MYVVYVSRFLCVFIIEVYNSYTSSVKSIIVFTINFLIN